jgi:hypothetical protein
LKVKPSAINLIGGCRFLLGIREDRPKNCSWSYRDFCPISVGTN